MAWKQLQNQGWLWLLITTKFEVTNIFLLSKLSSYWLSKLKYMACRPLVMFSFMERQMVQYWTIFKLCLKLCFVCGTLLRILISFYFHFMIFFVDITFNFLSLAPFALCAANFRLKESIRTGLHVRHVKNQLAFVKYEQLS